MALFSSVRAVVRSLRQGASALPFEVLWPLTKVGIIIVAFIILLIVKGQPGVRVWYRHYGTDTHPRFAHCEYLTLFDGWHEVLPMVPSSGACPLIQTFPFHLAHLFGG